MDVKVYKKEEVLQPSGREYVYKPDIIDLIPTTVEVESNTSINRGVWSLEQLKAIADVDIIDNKLVINSDKVSYVDGNLTVRIKTEQIVTVETLDTGTQELAEQEVALATIFQRGLDPLDLEDGIQWSEALLGEINALQLMEEVSDAVKKASIKSSVQFDVIETNNGQSVLSYKVKVVA